VIYSIETAAGTVMAGDCAFKYENIEEGRPLGIAESIIEGQETYRRIRKEAAIFLPLYDPCDSNALPEGTDCLAVEPRRLRPPSREGANPRKLPPSSARLAGRWVAQVKFKRYSSLA
jgi:hypothetical protein